MGFPPEGPPQDPGSDEDELQRAEEILKLEESIQDNTRIFGYVVVGFLLALLLAAIIRILAS